LVPEAGLQIEKCDYYSSAIQGPLWREMPDTVLAFFSLLGDHIIDDGGVNIIKLYNTVCETRGYC
jgi:hypothetical protein